MSRIFIFGYDRHYPQGGFNDLKATLDPQEPDVLDASGRVSRQEMLKFFENNGSSERYHVAYFARDGQLARIEYWEQCEGTSEALSDGAEYEPLEVIRYGIAERYRLCRVDVRESGR